MYWKVYSTIANGAFVIANKINDYCYKKVEKHYSKKLIQPDVEAIFNK